MARLSRSAVLRSSAKAITFATLGVASILATAQTYPNRPIRFISPSAQGGNGDILNRVIGESLSRGLGQPVLTDNRPGGSSTIGTAIVAEAPPDGYTLLMIASTHTTNAGFFSDLPYDSVRDFTPITMVGATSIILVANPGIAATSIRELIALAKARPGTLNFASSGNGSPAHLAGELLNAMAGIKLTHIPYKATAQGITDTMGGTIQLAFPGVSSVLPHMKSGKLKALGITSLRRSTLTPDIPTVAETVPGYQTSIWNGVLAPAGMSKPIVTRLNTEIIKALNAPEVRAKFASMGVEMETSTSEEFGAFIEAEIKKWARVIKDLDIKVEMER